MFAFATLTVIGLLSCSAIEHQRIVNGTIAHPCELPHLVYVVIYKEIGKMMCSGSLIDSTHVASAGHCVDDTDSPINRVTILFGSLNRRTMTTEISVSHFTKHEKFHKIKGSILNDVAVLTLSRPVKFNKCLKPIRLAALGELFVGECIIAGWGRTGPYGQHSDALLRATVPIMNPKRCQSYANHIQKQHLCAGDAKFKGRSACKGDSGGPLTCISAVDGQQVLAGIVSYGWTCREGYSIFARITYFRNWFFKQIGHLN